MPAYSFAILRNFQPVGRPTPMTAQPTASLTRSAMCGRPKIHWLQGIVFASLKRKRHCLPQVLGPGGASKMQHQYRMKLPQSLGSISLPIVLCTAPTLMDKCGDGAEKITRNTSARKNAEIAPQEMQDPIGGVAATLSVAAHPCLFGKVQSHTEKRHPPERKVVAKPEPSVSCRMPSLASASH